MKKNKFIILIILTIISGMFISSCADSASVDAPAVTGNVTDYSAASHWLKLPDVTDKPVDVFYLYPTAWQKNRCRFNYLYY